MKTCFAAGLLALATVTVNAADAKLGKISVEHAYARATVAGQPMGGAFMTIVNGGADDKLLGVTSDAAKSAELHMMAMKANVMQMRQIDAIEIKGGQTTELKPGGYHVMLIGLKAPLAAGSSVPVTLKFEKAGELKLNLAVEAAGAMSMENK